MCISFVVAKPPARKKAPPKPAPTPVATPAPPAEEAPAAPVGFFFDTRTGRYFVRETAKEKKYTRLVEVPPPSMQPMALPQLPIPIPAIAQPPAIAAPPRHRRKAKPKLLEAAPAQGTQWTWATTAEELDLHPPEGVGYSSPNEAIEAAVEAGLEVGNRHVHVMPGRKGGYFVVGVSDLPM
ncbi:hypothetical protein ABW21_db0202830 [Orbilia brochopaga]|nr:hypothetical protein ABW21_db0202830 [Drechslerella brochopaga]